MLYKVLLQAVDGRLDVPNVSSLSTGLNKIAVRYVEVIDPPRMQPRNNVTV